VYRLQFANPPNAQLEGTPTILASYIRVRAVVWECGEGQTDRHTDTQRDTQTALASIHFASAVPRAKCNNEGGALLPLADLDPN